MYLMNKKNSNQRGGLLVQVLVYSGIATMLLTALVSWASINVRAGREAFCREQAFQISEAGIDYYRWHLAHWNNDYKDGTAIAGPYIHTFNDKDGNPLGTYSLDIIAPPVGSTVVTVRSKGMVSECPSVYRRIEAKFAIPSFAKYVLLSNAQMFFGAGDEVFGPLHSNGGIGFLAGTPAPKVHNKVTSGVASFSYGGSNRFGVFTTVPAVDPAPGSPVPNRPDVFMGGRQFPVPSVDFTGITADLSAIKAAAIASGFYRGSSGKSGYRVLLKTNDTFDLYRVDTLQNTSAACKDMLGQTGWGSWSVKNDTLLSSNNAIPANGLLFFEDNVWVEGKINTARVTIAVAKFPDSVVSRPNIIINNNLTYTNYDGQDVIGLISQGNVLIGMVSADVLQIDAAVLAQNGAIFRYYYEGKGGGKCNPYHLRTSITFHGAMASFNQSYFAYSDSGGVITNGYQSQPAYYDSNLLYAPPPSFPKTSDKYEVISWKEIR